jgi:hypothetical protein
VKWQALSLALLFCLSCREGRSTDGLAVDLSLDRSTVSVDDTLSGTIRLRNTRLGWVTVEFPNAEQAELLVLDRSGETAVAWPLIRHPALSELSLGPLCGRDYEFRFPLRSFKLVDTLRPGTYRARAKPADFATPFTEKTLELTD